MPLRSKQVLGIVLQSTTKPRFPTKDISRAPALPPLPGNSIRLAEWVQKFYAAPIGVIMQQFLPPHLPERYTEAETMDDAPHQAARPNDKAPLTEQQRDALAAISKPDTYLLHGRTGSGKTRIYIELAKRAFANHGSSIILAPEIGLTSHLARAFEHAFPGKIVVLHSQLTAKERARVWIRILRSQEPLIVIGARSALFSPLGQLGLIVVDEEHDQAYKQEQPPYYHAVRAASKLRQINGCTLILGSATPSIQDYYLAQATHKPILRLDQVAIPSSHEHSVVLVDMKDRSLFKRSSHISIALSRAIESSLAKGEQSLLYLNRRGTARVTLCTVCGWQALCPNCDLPLTFHGDLFTLQCHVCGYHQPQPTACPSCGNPSIEFHSFGTKAIAHEVQLLFPEARTLRIDSDNSKAESLEHQLESIASGSVDILVGTQLVAKGLDLPRLSTVGVIAADTSLFLPDYTAKERSYQLLTQVIGRVGRGHTSSKIIVQTYQPESKLVRAALHDDWSNFYNDELDERRKYSFPPFVHLLKISCRQASATKAEHALMRFKYEIESQSLGVGIEGPTPAFHEKRSKLYCWQIVVKATDRNRLLGIASQLPKGWSYDIDPVDLL